MRQNNTISVKHGKMKCNCNEIFKLKHLLSEANIPFEFYNRCYTLKPNRFIESWQIVVPNMENKIISIVEGVGTFGYTEDKLEIKGLLTDYEKEFDCVVGSLSANEVMKRIEQYNIKINGKWG